MRDVPRSAVPAAPEVPSPRQATEPRRGTVPDAGPLSPDAAGRQAARGGDLVPTTYYGRPLLKKSHWETNVIAYLFLGGIMGGCGMIAAFADRGGDDRALSRNTRYAAFLLAATNPAILIGHLGRPERFLNMLRIWKFKSVMSMGVWGLVFFSLPATLAAAAELAENDFVPESLRFVRRLAPTAVVEPLLAVLGAFIMGYTGVLLCATAIPFWAKGKRHIPFACAASGMSGACALNGALLELTGDGNASTAHRIERLELIAGVCEFLAILDLQRHEGRIGAPMFAGRRGKNLRLRTMLLGIVVPAALHLTPGRSRWKTLLASALTLQGGYVFRAALVNAGNDSADDPAVASRQVE